MNLGEFIIQKCMEAGLSSEDLDRILLNAARRFPGNVPEEKWEEQAMIWINNAEARQKEKMMTLESEKNDTFDTSILGGQAPQTQSTNNNGAFFNNFGEIIREDTEEQGRSR